MSTLTYQLQHTFIRLLWPLIATSITVSLFLLMAYLITPQGKVPQTVDEDPVISITREQREEKTERKERVKPDKPKQEEIPPPPPIVRSLPRANTDNQAVSLELPDFDPTDSLKANQGDRRATAIVKIPPQYPQHLLNKGTEGWVLVEFTITASGTVEDIRVVDGEPKRVFDKAAIRSIKRWKFQPKIVNGKPVAQYNMREVFRFEIQKNN